MLAGITLFVLLFGSSAWPAAMERTPSEVKSLYVKYVAQYTTWPDDISEVGNSEMGNGVGLREPLVIGLVGPDPNGVIELIRGVVQSDDGMAIKQRPVTLIDFPSLTANAQRRAVVAALDKCHLLFFSEDSESDWSELKPMLQGRAIMTMSELPGFAVQGGVVEFEYDQSAQRMYMIVNIQALQDAGIVMSANLLKLKKIIKPLNNKPPR
jgi:hypothetical protein